MRESCVTGAPGLPTLGCYFYVVYTRPRAEKIVRRKECRHCGRRLTTTERVIGG